MASKNQSLARSSSHYSLVHFFATALPDRGPQPRKHRPDLSNPKSHCTCRNAGVLPSIASPLHSHAPECHYNRLFNVSLAKCYYYTSGSDDEKSYHGHASVTRGNLRTKFPLVIGIRTSHLIWGNGHVS